MKNTFLNGDLKEEVFMNLPSGFEKKLGKEKVCRLKKSLYCFKLFPGACFERFGKVIKLQGYIYILSIIKRIVLQRGAKIATHRNTV